MIKKILFFLFLLTANVFASEQTVLQGRIGIASITSTTYSNFTVDTTVPSTNESYNGTIAPVSGTISKFRLKANSALADGMSWRYTLRVNGVDSAISVLIQGDQVVVTDEDVVNINPGDVLTVKIVPTGSPTQIVCLWSCVFTSNNGETIFLGHSGTGSIAQNNRYGLNGSLRIGTSTLANEFQYFPISGYLTNFYARTSVAPGTGKSTTFKFYKNGVLQDNPSITIADSNTNGNDVVNTLRIEAGDYVAIQSVNVGTTSFSGMRGKFGVAFVPDIPHTWVLIGNSSGADRLNIEYGSFASIFSISSDEDFVGLLMPFKSLLKTALYIVPNNLGSTGDGYGFVFRRNNINTNSHVEFFDNLGIGYQGRILETDVTINEGDVINWASEPLNEPSVTLNNIPHSFLFYNRPIDNSQRRIIIND